MTSTAILYHAGCVDGFTAAWAVHRAIYDDVREIRPVNHGSVPPPDLPSFDRVFVVDFAYPYHMLVKMAAVTELIVLDHHRSAMENIVDGLSSFEWCDDFHHDDEGRLLGLRVERPFKAVFDMRRSGAGIAWDYITCGTDRPPLVDIIEDRDLWNNRLPGTREVSAYLRCLEHDLELWDWLASVPIEDLIAKGDGCTTQLDAVIRAAVAEHFMCELGDTILPMTNVTYLAGSETAEALLDEHELADVAGYFFVQADGRWKYGFRSRPGTDHARRLAEKLGGGGHGSASGAVLPEMAHTRLEVSDAR